MSNLITKAVYLAVSLMVGAILFAVALTQIATANTSGWQSSVITIFEVALPVLGIVVFVLYLINEVRHGTGRKE